MLFLGWLLTCGLIVYGAIIKDRAGEGRSLSIMWGLSTSLWVGVVAILIGVYGSNAAVILWYLGYAAWLAGSLWVRLQADEHFTGLYGSLRRYRVRYLGGHPGFRVSPVRGELLVTQTGLVFVNRYRAGATPLCTIPVERIGNTQAAYSPSSVFVANGPLVMPVASAYHSTTLAVEFCNDLNGHSVAIFGLGTAYLATSLKNDIAYAVYDWQRTTAPADLQGT